MKVNLDELKEKYYCLYANCIPVKGFSRSIIMDTQRNEWFHIPNDLYKILINKNRIRDLLKEFQNEREIIQEYFNFLLSHDLIFFTDHPERFPEFILSDGGPELINNAIIDSNKLSNHNYDDIFSQLDLIGCKNVQIRSYSKLSESDIVNIEHAFRYKRVTSVEIITKYNKDISLDRYLSILKKNLRIKSLIIHSTPKTKIEVINNTYASYMGNLIYTSQIIDSDVHCGEISKEYFNCNIDSYVISKKYNSCLYKKISIDVSGNIKNCPSMSQDFGSIRNLSLMDVIVKSSFQKKWKINKDQINVCKDCEYRYICSDCRAFLNEDNENEKPKKCTYDPYSNLWDIDYA